jgi:hypothetical protein
MVLKRKNSEKEKDSWENGRIRLAGKSGFEPRFHDPESWVRQVGLPPMSPP